MHIVNICIKYVYVNTFSNSWNVDLSVTPRDRCARCPPVIHRVTLSLLACHAFHIISSCAFHLHTCSSHASEHFPRCSFCIPALLCPPASPFTSFRVWVLNVLGLDRDLPSGLGSLPVDRLSSFVPFGLRLILQRLTEEP